jgi:hypothetical protein
MVIIRALVWLLWWSGQRDVDYLLLVCFGVAAACGLWMTQGAVRWLLAALFCSRRCNRRQGACCKQQQPSAASQRPDHMAWHNQTLDCCVHSEMDCRLNFFLTCNSALTLNSRIRPVFIFFCQARFHWIPYSFVPFRIPLFTLFLFLFLPFALPLLRING